MNLEPGQKVKVLTEPNAPIFGNATAHLYKKGEIVEFIKQWETEPYGYLFKNKKNLTQTLKSEDITAEISFFDKLKNLFRKVNKSEEKLEDQIERKTFFRGLAEKSKASLESSYTPPRNIPKKRAVKNPAKKKQAVKRGKK